MAVTGLAPGAAGAAPPAAGAPTGRRGRVPVRTVVRQDPVTLALVVVVVAILVVLVVLPLATVLVRAVSGAGAEVLVSMVTSAVNRKIILNTVILGVVVGLTGTVVGFLFAYAQARLKFRGKRLLHVIALIPIVSPPFAVATASITLFGRNGIISNQLLGQPWNIYGLPGLWLVLSISFFPVAYMNLLGMLRSLDPSMDEAAQSLGASKWHIFRTVTLPMLIPGFASSFLLLFVEAIADLANPLVLGGDFTVLASRAYIAVTGEYNVPAGSAYSLVLLLPAVTVFLVQRYWVAQRSTVSVTGKPSGRVELLRGFRGRVPLLTVVGLITALILSIYGTVVVGG
ncbi:MAG TPA: ABC transporter permease subunit, partial [Phototrophicaceae bacterium]|nr:ABC transporter permease subunit [Phototrophicaceae bacterium]